VTIEAGRTLIHVARSKSGSGIVVKILHPRSPKIAQKKSQRNLLMRCSSFDHAPHSNSVKSFEKFSSTIEEIADKYVIECGAWSNEEQIESENTHEYNSKQQSSSSLLVPALYYKKTTADRVAVTFSADVTDFRDAVIEKQKSFAFASAYLFGDTWAPLWD
jgi:hypothetical protein